MLHFEVELEVAYELSSRLQCHDLPDFVFFPTWYVIIPSVPFIGILWVFKGSSLRVKSLKIVP